MGVQATEGKLLESWSRECLLVSVCVCTPARMCLCGSGRMNTCVYVDAHAHAHVYTLVCVRVERRDALMSPVAELRTIPAAPTL